MREPDATPLAGPSNALERYGAVGALLLVLLGLALRLRGLSEYWLNPDEGIYYSTLTRASAGEFWAEVMANAHPPAFYLLLRGVGFLTWDFVWLRGASMIFGTLAIWAFWLVGRELGGRGRTGAVTGLVAAGLLAINAEAIALSQLIRPYMLLLALLSLSLLYLLRYRSAPTRGNLIAYVAFVSLALLTHYSAVLAFGVFAGLVVHDGVLGVVDRDAWRRLAVSQAIPAVLFGALYLQHMGATMGSDLMGDALGSGGWLSGWLIASPADVWSRLLEFQILLLSPAFQARSALLLLAAIGLSAFGRDRTVAALAGTAVVGAVLLAALGAYPFGQTRHNTWLVVFTLPALGWLAGNVVTQKSRRAALLGSAGLAGLLLLGGPTEPLLGAGPVLTSSTEEKPIRREDLARLVVEQLDPEGEPRIILMSDQTYNLMMPLYASERQGGRWSADSSLLSFSYGGRDVVVTRRWDWDGWEDAAGVVQRLAATLPGLALDEQRTLLLVAGGWGSSLFVHIGELEEVGVIVDWVGAPGVSPDGERIWRAAGFVLDWRALSELP